VLKGIDIASIGIVLADTPKFGRTMSYDHTFPSATVSYLFNSRFEELKDVLRGKRPILVTDSNVRELYPHLFESYPAIVIPAGEENKNWNSVNLITKELLRLEADRNTVLFGVGGGMITDLTGFVASIYMRGIGFGFVPTTLLAMVDAAIGGKNGINFGFQKNLLGTFHQPQFILYDENFLTTLPEVEWSNGFAEVIKYGCIFDSFLFEQLLEHDIIYYQQNMGALQELIRKCADWKNKTVAEDEKEQSTRKLLNFGHTVGHALETRYNLPHGYAVSIGMVAAAHLSETTTAFDPQLTAILKKLLDKYHLPIRYDFNLQEVCSIIRMDKKRKNDCIDFVLLEKLGKAVIMSIPLETIQMSLAAFPHANSHQAR
jgi:3-dehydroquinate synthase